MASVTELIVAIIKQYGVWGLVLLTFLDAFISPIPPEVLFIPLSLVNPQRAFWLAFLTTGVSVAGALVGYWIGLRGGRPLLHKFFAAQKLKKTEDLIQAYGTMAVLIAAFTPIPFKLITISAGVFGLHLKKLVFWSTLGRGARFSLEASLIVLYGRGAKEFLESDAFSLLTLGMAVLGIIIYLFVVKKKSK